jgi:competence ComEA-like helix-hairpin-helix protein
MTTSLQRDIAAGRSSEIEGLIYYVTDLADKYRVSLPLYEKIAAELRKRADDTVENNNCVSDRRRGNKMNRADRAEELFRMGYNCSQSVFAAFADVVGMTTEEAAQIASPFGAGFGKLREVCGAVSGMTLLAGYLRGYSDPSDTAANDAVDTTAQMSGDYSSSGGLVNINTAGKDELKSLTGIGDVMAERIIEYRSVSLFKSKEDIMSVKGIGTATFNKIKDSITV